MMFRKTALLCCMAAVATAFQPSSTTPIIPPSPPKNTHSAPGKAAAVATAALSLLLATTPLPASATSDAAAQISLNALPPTSISVQIGDLPIIGNLLSGTYTKVPDGSIAKPSVTVSSPKNKLKAIQQASTGGHLEFDVTGKILQTHLDVDVAADEAGVAKVRVASGLIPKLPFSNLASASALKKAGKPSDWNVVTNLGSGESYYYNDKTGVSQLGKPE